MEVLNVFVGISKYSKLEKMLLVNINDSMKSKLRQHFEDDIDYFIKEIDDFPPFNPNHLILDEKYYVSLDEIDENNVLSDFKDTACNLPNISNPPEIIDLRPGLKRRGDLTESLSNNELIKFLLIELKNYYIFYVVNSRKRITGGTIIDVFKTKNSSSQVNVIQVNNGIPISDNITAIYKKPTYEQTSFGNLYVLDLKGFENMLHLNETLKKKAEENLSTIYSTKSIEITKTNFIIEFTGYDEIKDLILNNSREARRMARYDLRDIQYSINDIIAANKKLDSNNQLSIKSRQTGDDENKISINRDNYRTFIGIMHNGIIERLLGGQTEVVL